jgi:hypothetical protein
LPETSPFRPDVGLSAPNSPVTVAWTGTDTHHSLNIVPTTVAASGLEAGQKTTLPHFSDMLPTAAAGDCSGDVCAIPLRSRLTGLPGP